jgi:hypothetical protein
MPIFSWGFAALRETGFSLKDYCCPPGIGNNLGQLKYQRTIMLTRPKLRPSAYIRPEASETLHAFMVGSSQEEAGILLGNVEHMH